MRIIAGTKKGRRLESVPGKQTRPTTDKVKEALFNALPQPFFTGGIGLDLFAGSGGLGLEALSRGMERVVFVDVHPQAVKVLRQNVRSLELEEHSEIYRNDAFRALKALRKRELAFDIVFLDPPYARKQVEQVLHILDEDQLLSKGGIVVAESDVHTSLPQTVGDLQLIKGHKYGQTMLRMYQLKED